MEPRPNFHPVYISGQYLTSEHLNDTHNFLWQQEKATRYMLDGNGIVQGLDADFSGNNFLQTVSISRGFGTTEDGYIMQENGANNAAASFDKGLPLKLVRFTTADGSDQLMEETVFNAKTDLNPVTKATVDATELFTAVSKIEDHPQGTKTLEGLAVDINKIQPGYIVLAWLSIDDAENNYCAQGDCNSKGVQRNYNIRYFLMENKLFPVQNTPGSELPLCFVSRIKNLSGLTSVAAYNQNSFTAWTSSQGQLQPYFTANSGKQLSLVASQLGTDEQTAFTAAATKFTQIAGSVNAAGCPQYYNSFAAGLAEAINELVVAYNDYIRKYPSIGNQRMERTLIIGSFRRTGLDSWRYYFIPATSQTVYNSEKAQLRNLFLRVVAMVNKFVLQNALVAQAAKVNKVLAIPSTMGAGLLQNEAIPYYYDVLQPANNNELLTYWNPHGGSLGNIFCYYDSLIANRKNMSDNLTSASWTGFNFFRVEGHIGLARAAAIAAISNLIVNDGLPIQLIECDVNYKGPKKWIDWHADFVGKLNAWVPGLRKDFQAYGFDPLNAVKEKMNATSYRNVDEVIKIAKDFYSYSNAFYGKKKPKGIADPVIQRFQAQVKKPDIENTLNKFKEALAEQNDLQAQKLVTLKDLNGLEYLGGVFRGGTFVLLHNGTNVIGDGCLPYFYRIEQTRVYVPSR
jgi:hypothetical protein